MKKRIILCLLIVTTLSIIAGCDSNDQSDVKTNTGASNVKTNNKVYTCINEAEVTDGGKSITKLVYTLTNDNYTVSYQIINDDLYNTEELYKATKERMEQNVQEHNEKYASQYEWILDTYDNLRRTVSTRTYDMSEVRDSGGKTYDAQYKFFLDDGTYDIDAWMQYERENGHYTCSENK